MTNVYAIKEVFCWTREGYSARSILVVEHEGFDLTSQGFRILRNGKTLFPSVVPFKTREAAEAKIAELVAA